MNPCRGERLIDIGAAGRWLARPTLGAMVAIEAELGDLLDVAVILGDPSNVTLVALSTALEAWTAAGATRRVTPTAAQIADAAVQDGRVRALAEDARALVWTYFETGRARESKDAAEDPVGRALPWRDFVGPAIAIWGLAPDDAWGMTVPEWWAAADAHARAHGARANDGPTRRLSRKKAEAMASELRAESRTEMQKRWGVKVGG